MKKNYNEIYDLLINYYGLPELNVNNSGDYFDPLWASFEKVLAELDFKTILDDHTDCLANPACDDFRDRDWHTYQFEMEVIVNKLTVKMRERFKEFILGVYFPEEFDNKLLALETNALFLNFNYTDTLEKYYGINSEQVLYLHGKAKNINDEMILGHGVAPSFFEEKAEILPSGLDEEQMEMWREQMADNYEFSYDSGKVELMSYFKKSYKSTEQIIIQNQSFFYKLNEIKKIFVLGHSISEVDRPYFKKIVQSISEETLWIISYYSDEERNSHLQKMSCLGLDISQIQMIKIDTLKTRMSILF